MDIYFIASTKQENIVAHSPKVNAAARSAQVGLIVSDSYDWLSKGEKPIGMRQMVILPEPLLHHDAVVGLMSGVYI